MSSQLETPEILEQMAATFRERNKIYGDNWKNHCAALKAIFPEGIMLKDDFETTMYQFFSIILGKMTRLANAGFRHQDSIHDIAVYAAMMEGYLALVGDEKSNRGRARGRGRVGRVKRATKKGR